MSEMSGFEKKLKSAILKKRMILFASGLVALVSTCLAVILALSSVAALFVIPVPIKISLLIAAVATLLYGLYRFIIVPAGKEKNPIKAAVQIEKNHPELKGRLIAALQFKDFDFSRTSFSQMLIDMTRRQATELTGGINFNEIVTGYPLWRKFRSGFGIVALAAIIALLVPGIFSNALEVYSQPTVKVAPPPGFTLMVTPGNVERIKYADVNIGGILVGSGFPDEAEIYYRFSEGRWQSEKLELGNRERFKPEGDELFDIRDSLPFGLTLKQVRRSMDYYVVAGEFQSATYAINIVERPRVTRLKATVNYPAYTGLSPLVLDENNGSFAALVGSRVNIQLEANRDIDEAYLVVDDSTRRRIDFRGNAGEINLVVESDLFYYIKLFDHQGEVNPDPIEYMITAIPDDYPLVTVLYPGYDLNLDEDMMIPFQVQISDDFGFSSLLLKYQLVSGNHRGAENVAIINFSDKIQTEGEVTFNWDLDRFNMLPSDYILYHFELADNDKISGPKISSTRVFAARLPSIDEIVREAEAQQEGRVRHSERLLNEQREMVQKLEQLVREVRAADNIDWQNKKELENILGKQEDVAQQLEKMAQEMMKSIDDMDKNNLLSEQILKKLQELQKLFSEVATQEMKDAMKKLQESLDKMSQSELEKAMKDFQLSQDEMLQRLERSVELLKRMQIEQKMSSMLKMAEEILLEQNRVNVDTDESKAAKDNQRLAQRENKLGQQLDALRKEAEKLDQLLKDSPLSESQGHSEFSEVVKQNSAGENMEAMEKSLKQDKKNNALSEGQKSSEKLSSMVNKMRDLINQLSSQQGKELAEAMRKAINDTNYLSQKQESLHGRCQKSSRLNDGLSEIAAEQQVLKEAVGGLTERIRELAKQSPFLAAEIESYLKQSQQEMAGACDNLGNLKGRASQSQQREAMYNLNRASIRLFDGLNEQKQCNKGGSCNKMSQKMQSMCEKQGQINQQTKGLCNKPGQNLTPGQRQAMERLAGEQGTIQKSVQELQAEFGNRREILGRLDGLERELGQIKEMMKEGQAGSELVDRQLRIYSRMLDMQKSLTRRDFTRERQANTGADILRNSPGALGEDGSQSTESLQSRLNRYLKEGYPRQYEQHIKAYFKALSSFGQDTENRK